MHSEEQLRTKQGKDSVAPYRAKPQWRRAKKESKRDSLKSKQSQAMFWNRMAFEVCIKVVIKKPK